MNPEKERLYLTEEEMVDFDFTGGSRWELRQEVYTFEAEIRTDQYSDGPSWDTVVKRQSDGKLFKWGCWDSGREYYMQHGDNYLEEVTPKKVTTTQYEWTQWPETRMDPNRHRR